MRGMKRIVVLGCGLVGGVMVRDLSGDEGIEVTVADVSEKNLASVASLPRVKSERADLADGATIDRLVKDADCVVGAVPGRIGFAMLRRVIEAGKPISDISFAPEDAMQLDDLARSRGVTAVVDCGVSPGLSNLAIGRAVAMLDTVDSATIFVGGLPVPRLWPFEYRSVFSPTDVIEEYTRPARLIENGQVVIREALSEVELLDFPEVGTLEAFNSDGLRTVLTTVKGRNMKEKTLRYPGHADRMRMMRETGLFSGEAVEVDGVQVIPRRLTERLMFEKWRRPAGEEELTILRVQVTGSKGEKHLDITYDLVDRTDRATGETSMARTTGFPCVIMARLLARGEYADPGVRPPELFGGNPRVYDFMLAELRKRGVELRERVV